MFPFYLWYSHFLCLLLVAYWFSLQRSKLYGHVNRWVYGINQADSSVSAGLSVPLGRPLRSLRRLLGLPRDLCEIVNALGRAWHGCTYRPECIIFIHVRILGMRRCRTIIFGGLVLGYIDAGLCKYILVTVLVISHQDSITPINSYVKDQGSRIEWS